MSPTPVAHTRLACPPSPPLLVSPSPRLLSNQHCYCGKIIDGLRPVNNNDAAF
ncbi:MAG: hypothetical protein ACHBN1_23050 [Heteroscytonema crispum UTEX LB 1556]